MATKPPAWMEKYYVKIERQGGTYSAAVEGLGARDSLELPSYTRGFESIATMSQGRIYKYLPDEDGELSFSMYPIDMNLYNNSLDKFFIGVATPITSDGASTSSQNTHNRYNYRVTILFTNDTTVGTATEAVNTANVANTYARRLSVAECQFVEYKQSMSDGLLKADVTFKVPPFDSSADGNYLYESLSGGETSELSALTAYTTSNKFR